MPVASELGVSSVLDVVVQIFNLEGELFGDEYRMLCPNPQHNDTSPSCSVNTETGYYHCYSCGVGGDLADLGALVLKQDREQVLDALRPGTVDALRSSVASKLSRLSIQSVARRRSVPLPGPYSPGPLRYLLNRGFTRETLEHWGIRYCKRETLTGQKGPFEIEKAIAIPIKDENGKLLCWCYRNTVDGWWRYLYSDGSEVSKLWFGLQHHARLDEITVVEGALDAMWVTQCGYPALGLLGAGMAGGKKTKRLVETKVRLLQRYKSVTLMGDRDAGGVSWVNLIGPPLSQRTHVRVTLYKPWMDTKAKDPQDLPPVDVDLMQATSMPWHRYASRGRSA